MDAKIEINDAELGASLSQAANLLGDTLPLTRALAGIMHSEVEDNFEAEGRPHWKPLKPSTIAQRRREGNWPGKILNRSGGRGLVGSIFARSDETMAIVGTNKVYARLMNFGGTVHQAARSLLHPQNKWTRGEKKGKFKPGLSKTGQGPTSKAHNVVIPARPFMTISAEGIQKLKDRTLLWIQRAMEGLA